MTNNYLPTFETLPIAAFSSVFSDTTNSYKLYWMYAIVDILKNEGIESEIEPKDIATRMIALAWYPVAVFRLSLGKQDQIAKTVKEISSQMKVEDDAKPIEIHQKIKDLCKNDARIDKLITDFLRYVPFRFLTPFFSETLKGRIDVEKNGIIEELSELSFNSIQPSIYKIKKKGQIHFHPIWLDYFKRHLGIIESYNLWHLVRYLESRNPNVQGISSKILPPQKRDLSTAKQFWNIVLQNQTIECIYSSEIFDVESTVSIDHFVPWSFVAHDYLWNLSPTTKSINSSKSDNLPKLDLYLSKFTKIQFEAFNIVLTAKKPKLLEDYVLLFQDSTAAIANLSENDFRTKLEKHIIPLSEIASNIGFKANWIL